MNIGSGSGIDHVQKKKQHRVVQIDVKILDRVNTMYTKIQYLVLKQIQVKKKFLLFE